MITHTIRPATPADLDAVSALLKERAQWAHKATGNDAWPYDGFPAYRLTPGLESGTIWLLEDRGTPLATLALDHDPEGEFISPEAEAAGLTARLPNAMMLHRFATSLKIKGTWGSVLLDWAADRAARQGALWLFLNAPKIPQGEPLRDYYARNGFGYVTTVHSVLRPDGQPRRSGSLWTRRTQRYDYLKDRLREVTEQQV